MTDVLKRRLDRVQKTAVDRAIDLLESEGQCLIFMTTGTGKTTVGAKWALSEEARISGGLWASEYQANLETIWNFDESV